MTWNDITLGQFQDVHRLAFTQQEELDRITTLIAILYNKTEAEVEDMNMTELNAKAKACAFVFNQKTIPGKPVRWFRANHRSYAVNYKVTDLKSRQYAELMTFGEQPIEKMHLFLASFVQPVKWGIRMKNKAEDHERIAEDMKAAPLPVVYHISLFFCRLYKNSIEAIQDSLVQEMMAKGKTKEQAEALVQLSKRGMDSFITTK